MEGWKKYLENWFYFVDGKQLTGWQKLKSYSDNDVFYFDEESGKMLTGWQK